MLMLHFFFYISKTYCVYLINVVFCVLLGEISQKARVDGCYTNKQFVTCEPVASCQTVTRENRSMVQNWQTL